MTPDPDRSSPAGGGLSTRSGEPSGDAALRPLGRFRGPAGGILRSLGEAPKTGTELLDELSDRRWRVRPGTLFGAIARLERLGLIESLPGPGPRRRYRLSGPVARPVPESAGTH